jgi:phage baseplate assembly protein W
MPVNRHNGSELSGRAHVRQSIVDILTTPIGSRVMRRDYGSALPDLVDRPMNPQTRLDAISATAEALERWEPRVDVSRVVIERAEAGVFDISVFATDAKGRPFVEAGVIV